MPRSSSGRIGNVLLILTVSIIFLSSIIPTTLGEVDHENGIPEWLHEKLDSDPDDPHSLGVYALYDPDYSTSKYTGWRTFEEPDGDDTITIATERLVVRRGTRLLLQGDSEADASIRGEKEGLTALHIQERDDGWEIDVPDDCTVGKYIFSAADDDGSHEMEIFVVYDPWAMGISEDKLRAYAYDEESDRPEVDYIITTGHQTPQGVLRPFGDEREGWLDMYEFALSAVGNTTDPQEAAARIVRVVAQRSIASPSGFEGQPALRDASQILFGSGTTTILDEELQYQGLTLEDAEILSQNGRTINEIANYDQVEASKLINAWCDEVSWATASLLRSVGIPSRVASLHPTAETQLMGHFMVEVWFEESLYHTDWDDDEGGWFVLDADEWNIEWHVEDPVFWMPLGECFTSRSNYRRVAEVLFDGRYEFGAVYVSGLNHGEFIDVSNHYITDEETLLDHGTLTKLKGRGGGDLYRVEVGRNSRLTLESSHNVNASIYVSRRNYPLIPVAEEGYPFTSHLPDLYDDEVVLGEGTYYVGIYAPQNSDPSVEGDFGTYTLHLEETPHLEPTFMDVREIPDDLDLRSYLGHLVAFLLLVVWAISYHVMKKTR